MYIYMYVHIFFPETLKEAAGGRPFASQAQRALQKASRAQPGAPSLTGAGGNRTAQEKRNRGGRGSTCRGGEGAVIILSRFLGVVKDRTWNRLGPFVPSVRGDFDHGERMRPGGFIGVLFSNLG